MFKAVAVVFMSLLIIGFIGGVTDWSLIGYAMLGSVAIVTVAGLVYILPMRLIRDAASRSRSDVSNSKLLSTLYFALGLTLLAIAVHVLRRPIAWMLDAEADAFQYQWYDWVGYAVIVGAIVACALMMIRIGLRTFRRSG